MKIISYNVNGIRAAIKKGFFEWLEQENPDVLCIQEIKAKKDQLDLEVLSKLEYPYHYWYSAQKKGYSGVAILSKKKPKNIIYGTAIDYMDYEGRNLRIDFDKISIMSLYLPSGTNLSRLNFKLVYMKDFLNYINDLKNEFPNLVICGDYNICHKEIDIHNPEQNENTSGFLPVERNWISEFIKSGFIDAFRYLNKEPDNYSWWSYRANARANNKGWRIDYTMISESLKDKISNSFILSDVKHSDHCPIGVELNI